MGSSNLKRMMQFSILTWLRHFRLASPGRVMRSLPLIALAACAALSLPFCASAKGAKDYSAATLV
jgi:hypothetical protein